MDPTMVQRAAVHAALGEPARLGIVEELARSDRSPSELAELFDLPSNLLAHHLGVLERCGLVDRIRSSGDGRRRYLRLARSPVIERWPTVTRLRGPVLFVCTHNSARSQLAAALWRQRTGEQTASAGTHPAPQVHPAAVAAARRAGLDLTGARPRRLDPDEVATTRALVVTVCDRAHEELHAPPHWWHWSIPDPAAAGTDAAFDAALADLGARIALHT